MPLRRVSFGYRVLLALALLAPLAPLAAQRPAGVDIIRGRIVDADSQPVAGARVQVRIAKGTESRETVTNERGAYTVLFPGTAGDYVVTARFVGLAPANVRVVRAGASSVLTGDLTLAPARGAPNALERVIVRARQRPRPPRSDGIPPVDDGTAVGEDVLRDTRDDFGAPFDPRRFSVLGTDPTQNALSVNGADVQTVLPDAVGMGGRVITTSADAGAGGFSGGRLAVDMGGAESYHLRYLAVALAPAALQWVDRPSAEAGARSTTLNGSLWTSDPWAGGRAHTTSVLTVSQRTTPLPEFPTSSAGLARLGLAPDSLARFLALTGQAGIPAMVNAVPSHQRTTRAAWMGRLDLGQPDATTRVSVDANLGTGGTEGEYMSSAALASHGGRTRQTGGFVSAALSRYVRDAFLTNLATTVNGYETEVAPYLALPEGRVRVLSALPAGDSALTWLAFGGNPAAAGRTRTATWQVHGSTTWLSVDSTHRHRVGGDLFTERLWADEASNVRGTFEFESLEALAAGRATRFTRRTESGAQRGSGIRGALYTDNRLTVRPSLIVQYGLRLDAARIAAPLLYNPAVDSVFGARTDALPRLASVSPRIGVRWEYGARNGLPSSLSLSAGRYQSYLGAATAIAASQATGLSSAARLLDCVGDAVPVADWARYGADPTSIPGACADGSGAVPVTPAVPSVLLFDRFEPSAVWRAALTWDIRRWTAPLRVTLIHSRGTAQPSAIDRNLQPTPQFTLATEAERPVYVPASAVVPATGATALADSRRSAPFGPVLARVSDLHSTATQVVVSKGVSIGQHVNVNTHYRWQTGRAQTRGFDGPTAGDPFVAVWGPSPLPRHGLGISTYLNFSTQLRLNGQLTLQSGIPFTPLVAGDVNGDGASNDIAFVPPPSSALGRDVAAALRGAPSAAQRCLARQAGRTAGRNSCTGPWSAGLDLRLEVAPSWLPSEAGLLIDLVNATGVVDRLLHGASGARGWGDPSSVDPTLLVVRGFDPAAQAFLYQVNPRFGRQAGSSAWHRPIELRVQLRTPIGPSLTTQQNRTRARAVRESRGNQGAVRRVLPAYDVFAVILRLEKPLLLGPDQTESLRTMQGHWRQAIDSVQAALTAYTEQLSDSVPDRDIVARVAEAAERAQATTRAWLPAIRSLLTEAQLAQLPRPLQGLVTGHASDAATGLDDP